MSWIILRQRNFFLHLYLSWIIFRQGHFFYIFTWVESSWDKGINENQATPRLLSQVSPSLSSNAFVGGRCMSPYIINALTVSSCYCPQGVVPLMMPTLSLSLSLQSAHQWSPRWLPHLPMHSNLVWLTQNCLCKEGTFWTLIFSIIFCQHFVLCEG
jgi:hypothetical protein